MSPKSAVVVVIDGLGTLCLGPYGNTWMDTPGWNHLAAKSLVCEQMLVDSPDPEQVYRGYWQGRHALAPEPSEPPVSPKVGESPESGEPARGREPSLPELLREQGVRGILLTDDESVAGLPAAEQFDLVERLELPRVTRAASDLDRTQLASGLDRILDVVSRLAEPALVWVHLRGLLAPWDAPTDVRHQFADEEDPVPGDFVEPPEQQLGKDVDPDYLLTMTHAYAAQIVVLDACLATLDDALAASRWGASALLAVTSCRGYPLGEHGRLGLCDRALFNELLHVPCLLRHPAGDFAGMRVGQLVQPLDLHATLLDWFVGDGAAAAGSRRSSAWGRSLWQLGPASSHPPRPACSVGPAQRAIRTPGWFLRDSQSQSPQLYVKPDDLWEVNEVADRCPDVVPQLLDCLEQFQQALAEDDPAKLPELPEQLVKSS